MTPEILMWFWFAPAARRLQARRAGTVVFDEFTPKLRDSTYGSDEYKAFLEGMGDGSGTTTRTTTTTPSTSRRRHGVTWTSCR
jgi:hypothetical protein